MSFLSKIFTSSSNDSSSSLKDIKNDIQIKQLTGNEQSKLFGGKRMSSDKSSGISEQTPQ